MVTKLGKLDIEHVARLAKLPVASNELPKFSGQLGKIVEYVGQVSKSPSLAERSGAGKILNPNQSLTRAKARNKQFQNPKSKTNAVRRDEVGGKEYLTQEEATGNAKNKHNGLFVVPAIFGE